MVFKVPHTLGANHPEPVLGKRFKYPKGILGIFLCTIFRIIFVLVHLKWYLVVLGTVYIWVREAQEGKPAQVR